MELRWVDRIRPRLESVRERIALAAGRSDRSPSVIQLVAITKGHPIEAIEAAVAVGLQDIGENRVGEALTKQEQLKHLDVTWHMVGHIQSRKARDIPGHFDWVHSIDRLKIAHRLNRYAVEQGMRIPVLLECNVSGEVSKEGWNLSEPGSWSAWIPVVGQILALPGLEVRGLMTMAPWVADEPVLRATFRNLRQLRDYLQVEVRQDLPELSMGMTDDFEYAIEEGATMIRVGRALFGPRPD